MFFFDRIGRAAHDRECPCAAQADDVFDYDDMTHAKVVGKISAPHGLGYLEAFRREKKLPGGARKAAMGRLTRRRRRPRSARRHHAANARGD